MALFSKPPFGLDVSDLSIQTLQLNKKNKIIADSYFDIDSGIVENGKIIKPEDLAGAIRQAMQQAEPRQIKSKEVVASLPDSQLFTCVCNVEGQPGTKKFEKNLQEAVRENMPIDIEDLYADYLVYNEGTEEQEALFVGVPKEIVKGYVEVFEGADLKPLALDMESGSLARCLKEEDFANGSVMIVDIGARTTILSIFIPQGLYFSMNVPVAGNEFSRKIADERKISLQEAEKLKVQYGVSGKNDKHNIGQIIKGEFQSIIGAISKAKEYNKYKLGEYPGNILLVGGTSKMRGIVEYLRDEVGPEVSRGNTEDRPMSTAYGLALRAIEKNPITAGINLYPKF